MDRIERKLNKLRKILKSMGSAVVACSGGADSAFLLKIARDELGKRVISATAFCEVYIKDDYKLTKKLAGKLKVRQIDFKINLLKIRDFFNNSLNRCYFCKKEMFKELKKIARREGMDYVLDGTNQDDILEFRPGRRALKELDVRSPLVEAGLNKKNIRSLSHEMGLLTWNKASSTCLATRIPHGERVSLKKLRMIEKGERFIKNLDISDFRLRHQQGDIARIEVNQSDGRRLVKPKLRSGIEKGLKKIGYLAVFFEDKKRILRKIQKS
ncbi:MAG: ATP-dependent sacrificial sulfur transferase LarE [Candidatus Omnitrophota bacterium]|nr:ATP-dependent sacrificial sulfur transferase LarE [Candidatus Omnitrophota bacterium]